METPSQEPENVETYDTPTENAATSPAAEAAPAEKPRRGFFARLFNPETRFGRFMRSATRILATVVGLFALGMLAVYLLLYRPSQQQLAQTRADLDQAQAALSTAQAERDDAQAKNDDLAPRLKTAEAHVTLLQAGADVAAARMALLKEDPAAARKALADTPALLDKLAPDLNRVDANLADTLKTRLDLALGEMAKDPELASSDLAIVADRLSEAETTLFGK
jgi:uncharacterized membrane-anchored protein YhcB (DUF1043 family)